MADKYDYSSIKDAMGFILYDKPLHLLACYLIGPR